MSSLFPRSALRAVVALGIAAAGLQAHAANPAVESVCPGVQAQLADALADLHREHATPSQVALRFAVQGDRIVDVVATGGPQRYQRAALRALRDLQCRSAGRQAVQLTLRFVDPQGDEALQLAGQAVATR